jgi:pimeloyl-ACP methyl ester carboxylesterase
MMAEMRSVRLEGEQHATHYYRAGSGEPVLYLHHLAGMQGWEPVHERLAERFDVIAPYGPGFGPTGEALEDFDSGLDLVLHYRQLLESLGLGKVNLFGHSVGAWVAAEFAAIQPQMVNRVVLVNPVGIWSEELGGQDPYAQPPMAATAVLFARPEGRLEHVLKGGSADPLEVYVQEMRDLKASAKFLWPVPDTGIARRLRFIGAPTLVLTCELDRVVPPGYGTAWADAIAGASRLTIDGAGHLVNLEDPGRLADLAGNFLAGGE